MRLIKETDERVYQAVSFAVKLGQQRKLLDRMRQRYTEQRDDVEVRFEYALALMANLQYVRSEVDGHEAYSATIETLGQVLSAAPGNWLARYGRARLRALVPSTFGIYQIPVEHERKMATEDLHELARLQAREPWRPYFACTHMQLAYVASKSNDWPTVQASIKAAAGGPPAPVGLPALGSILCEPFLAVYGVVDADERTAVGDVMARLFPDQPMVVAALREPTGTGT